MGKSASSIAIAILAAASSASATQTLVDFTDGLFPDGDGPLNYRGLTFTNSGSGVGGPGMTGSSDWTGNFDNIPGASLGLGFTDQWGNTDLRLDFPLGTTTVELLLSTSELTLFAIDFYAPGDVLLGTQQATMPGQDDSVVANWEDTTNGIAYVRVYEPNGDNTSATLIDDVRYSDQVPTPGTAALLALGALAAGQRRR